MLMQRWLLIFLVAYVTGCASAPVQTLRFHEQVTGNLPSSHTRPVQVASTGQRLVINPEPTLTERDVLAAKLEPTTAGDAIRLKFDSHGANLLAEMTTRLRGQSIVVFANDRPIAVLLVEHANASGELQLLGDLTDEQTKSLVESLNKTAHRRPDPGDAKPEP